MKSYKNKLRAQRTTDVDRTERFESIKNKIICSNGKISHDAVLQLFYDRMNNGEGRKLYKKLTFRTSHLKNLTTQFVHFKSINGMHFTSPPIFTMQIYIPADIPCGSHVNECSPLSILPEKSLATSTPRELRMETCTNR